jgi:hypothetical protein
MKALTVWQPWASLIAIGAKPYEFRSKPYKFYINAPKPGERIAIHAAARLVKRGEVADLLNRLERNDGAVNPCLIREPALALLRRIWDGFELRAKHAPVALCVPLSAVVCTAVIGEPKRGDLCAQEFGRGKGLRTPFGSGSAFNWGWPLTDIEPVMPPIEAKGKQGFWEWRSDAYARASAVEGVEAA